MKPVAKKEEAPVPKALEARARKLHATFVVSLRLKRTWDRINDAEKGAWRVVAQQ